MAHQTAARKADSRRATVLSLLAKWQELNALQHSINDQMAAVESRLSRHVDFSQPVEVGSVRGSYLDCCLDPNELPTNRAAWLRDSMAAAGL